MVSKSSIPAGDLSGAIVRPKDPPLRVAIWIFVIIIPTGWIGFDVFGDIVHFAFVADDMFVIIALPDGDSVRAAQAVDPPRITI